MIPSWASLNESERHRVLVARAFLASRLSERGTLDWALRLEPHRHAERFTVDDLLNGRPLPTVKEPYATAWRLIEESWAHGGTDRRPSIAVHNIRKRLREGDRSAVLVSEIANLLAPCLEVKPLEDRPWAPVERPRRPRRVYELLSANLTSVNIRSDFGSRREEIGLAEVCDKPFLTALASSLMAAVDRGIHIASRIYGEDDSSWGRPGKPARVYFVHVGDGTDAQARVESGGSEPDAFNRGIAPSVKFLHAAVLRIADIDRQAAMPFLWRWRFSDSSIYRRLWAASARDARLVSAEDVGNFIAALDENQYWDLNAFPEIAELRALRFKDLDHDRQAAIVRRLRSGPPRKYWRRDADEEIRIARRYASALELRRIEVAGGSLPTRPRGWLLEALAEFPYLEDISIEHGFTDTSIRWVRGPIPGPAVRFDNLDGEARLRALEGALSGGRPHWEDSAGAQARAWIQNPEQADQLLSDLESCADSAEEYPHVLDCFAWFHTPPLPHHGGGPRRNASIEAERVLGLMGEVSEATLVTAIGGICHWLHAWHRPALRSESGGNLWLRAWPIAVNTTNMAHQDQDDEFATLFRSLGSEERIPDVDTLNTLAGKLVRAFLGAFLPVDEIEHTFVDGHIGREMRDCIIEAPGHSRLIGRCLLIESFPSFLQANPEWTNQNLLSLLSRDDVQSILLWRAVASDQLHTHALTVIGDDLLQKVRDARLGERAREVLIFSVVFEDLRAFRENRDAAVPCARLSQMLRFADEEIRTCTARAVRIYQDEEPEKAERSRSAAEVFRSAVRPFLQQAWPQERSLGTPTVSQELSGIPAVSGEAFVETVEEIERFLMPFDCWSMFDYGFYDNGETGDEITPQLATMIDDEPKGHALLRLLDRTIGDAQIAVVPHDLSLALERIETVAPKLARDPAFLRLSAAARR